MPGIPTPRILVLGAAKVALLPKLWNVARPAAAFVAAFKIPGMYIFIQKNTAPKCGINCYIKLLACFTPVVICKTNVKILNFTGSSHIIL